MSKPKWQKEKRKKGFEPCRCGAVQKYCNCQNKEGNDAKTDCKF